MTIDVATAPTGNTLHMYRALVGVGMFCGLLIVTVFEVTRPIIAKNRAEALQRAVFTVIPEAESSETFVQKESGAFEPQTESKDEGMLVYAGYDEDESLVGVAVEARGMGYADVITVLYGYSFERDAIVGMQVLESKETPGLGDKIEKDPDFLANFEALDVSLAEGSVKNPIVAVKSGEKTEPWQIDGITGATISSVAIADMLRASSRQWIPVLEERQADFEKTGAGEAQP
ncbi:MAG: FMN-binding protein [Myxococcota bacterium]